MYKSLMTSFIFAAYALTSTAGLLFLRISLRTAGMSRLTDALILLKDFKFYVGFAMYCSSFLIWLYILSRHPLNIAYPIANSLVLVLVTAAGVLLLQEPMKVMKLTGIAACLVGITLVSIG